MAKDKDNGKEAPAESEASSGEVSLTKKISVKTVCGAIKKPKEDDKPKRLMRVFGVAHGTKSGTSNFGAWLAFKGSFEGINIETGEAKFGTECFLPEVAQDMMLSQLTAAQAEDKTASVQFAFEIGVKSAKNPIGYEYTVHPLLKPSGNDPLAILRNQVKALPAPKA